MMAPDLCLEEKLLSYSKYYYMEMSKPHPVSVQVAKQQLDPKDALKIENLNDLLKPGYLPVEQGFCHLPDGAGFIANYVYMPGVTPEMIDWWFVWHFIPPPSVPRENGNLRYKIWNPKEHWDAGIVGDDGQKRYVDQSIPLRERREGTFAFIEKSIGGDKNNQRMMIEAIAHKLEDYGLDMNMVRKPGFGTITGVTLNLGLPAVGLHYYRPREDGVELRTRYWLGYELFNKRPVRIFEGPQVTQELTYNFLIHNMTEYVHLAKFLPRLFKEESWKPVDAY
jgi:hypothetical protein